MSMILDLPKDVEAALAAQARAAQMAPEQFLAKMVAQAVENRRRAAAAQLAGHLDTMAATIAPETTTAEMEAALEDALAAVRPHRTW